MSCTRNDLLKIYVPFVGLTNAVWRIKFSGVDLLVRYVVNSYKSNAGHAAQVWLRLELF